MLRPFRVQLVSGTSSDPAVKDYLPARKLIGAASNAGLPLGVYMDQTYAKPHATPDTVRAMLELADPAVCDTVTEIGPGSGRYAEEVIAARHPACYKIYETAWDWLPWLSQLPNVVMHDANGRTLSQTPDRSVDLVHSHKLFVYTEFFATFGYLEEMARIVRPGARSPLTS